MKKHPIGYCSLCGSYGKLSYEHIPPEAAFNSSCVKMYTGAELLENNTERMPWEFHGLTYIQQQKGSGKYSLCESCNNNTGSWYGAAYLDMAQLIASALQHPEITTSQGIGVKDVYPLRFIKQILSMFCSVNDYESLYAYANPAQVPDKEQLSPFLRNIVASHDALYEASFLMDELRQFVLNRDAVGLNKKNFKVCMYLTRSPLIKFNSISASIHLEENTYDIVSEITAAPFGFLLYVKPSKKIKCHGIDITTFSDFGYNDSCEVNFPVEILEMNTYFPADYRSKDEIEKAVAANNTQMQSEDSQY